MALTYRKSEFIMNNDLFKNNLLNINRIMKFIFVSKDGIGDVWPLFIFLLKNVIRHRRYTIKIGIRHSKYQTFAHCSVLL